MCMWFFFSCFFGVFVSSKMFDLVWLIYGWKSYNWTIVRQWRGCAWVFKEQQRVRCCVSPETGVQRTRMRKIRNIFNWMNFSQLRGRHTFMPCNSLSSRNSCMTSPWPHCRNKDETVRLHQRRQNNEPVTRILFPSKSHLHFIVSYRTRFPVSMFMVLWCAIDIYSDAMVCTFCLRQVTWRSFFSQS